MVVGRSIYSNNVLAPDVARDCRYRDVPYAATHGGIQSSATGFDQD